MVGDLPGPKLNLRTCTRFCWSLNHKPSLNPTQGYVVGCFVVRRFLGITLPLGLQVSFHFRVGGLGFRI